MMGIDHIDSTSDFAALRDDWRRLFRISAATPFRAFEWASAWFDWFGADRRALILRAFAGGELVAILPLYVEDSRMIAMRVTRVGVVGDETGGADHLGLISAPGFESAAARAFVSFLQDQNRFGIISFGAVDADSKLSNAASDAGFESEIESVCPGIELAEGWERVLRSSKRADNFKRRLRKLEAHDGFEFRSVTDPADVGEAFERFFELHEARWRAAGGSELSGHPRLAGFHRDAVGRMAGAGLARFDEIWVEGKCRASVYGLESAGRFHYFNAGYDLDWASKSVGLVLIGLSVRSAIERGVDYYDFLRGDEAYKYDWSNRETVLVAARFARRSLPVTALEAARGANRAVATAMKRMLPAGLAEVLKAQKRKLARRRLDAVEPEPETV